MIGDYSTSLTDVNFNWQGRGNEDAHLKGAKGTPAESKVAHAWPSYEAEYLHKRLYGGQGKYATFVDENNLPALPTAREQVYLSKVADDYKEEADEALHTEFVSWLEGSHEDNRIPKSYVNGAGKPARRYTDRHSIPNGSKATIGDQWEATLTDEDGNETEVDAWHPTWWGEKSLAHLPGVREYLRQMKTKGMEADLQMNLLAEHGPQDLNQAWMYFKHWVKGRPTHSNLGEGVEHVNLPPQDDSLGHNRRSAFGWQPASGDGPPGNGFTPHPGLKGPVSAQQYGAITALPSNPPLIVRNFDLLGPDFRERSLEVNDSLETQGRLLDTLSASLAQMTTEITAAPLAYATELQELTDQVSNVRASIDTLVPNGGRTPGRPPPPTSPYVSPGYQQRLDAIGESNAFTGPGSQREVLPWLEAAEESLAASSPRVSSRMNPLENRSPSLQIASASRPQSRFAQALQFDAAN